jgi:sugar lactone lactonase YvrE
VRWISAHNARVRARPLSGLIAAACALAALAAAPAHAATTLVINPFAHTATPKGVAVDPATGDVYVADATDNEVFQVSPAGAASVLASGLNAPSGVAMDPSTGDVYIADTGDHEVKRLSANGTLSVVAGTGTAGAPTPGPAPASALGGPAGLAVDSAGNLYIADGAGASANPYVEKVTPGGTLSILAGNGTRSQPLTGPATSSPLRTPTGVALDPSGNVFIADAGANVVAKVTPAGVLSIFAGRSTGLAGQPTTGTATNSRLSAPTGLATDGAGDLYIADTANNRVEEVTPADRLSIFAGTGTNGAPSYGSQASLSPLNGPAAIALTSTGFTYVANATHATVDRIAPALPALSAAPTPTGTTTQGQTLTATSGTWANAPTAYAYGWERCDASGAACASIAGATGSSYTLTGDDAGATIRSLVTATNVSGATTVASTPTAVIIPQPPAGTAAPSIAGAATNLQILAGSPGSWTNKPTKFAYRWQDCDATGAGCAAIAGATASTYTLTLSDVGATIRVAITATNAGGSETATSGPTAIIAPALVPWADTPPPGLQAAPSVSGAATVGSALVCSTGRWSNGPTDYAFQWNRGNAPIAGATAATYTVIDADRGQALSCTVIATNAGGAIQADSARVTVPRPVACPTASGIVSGSALGPLQLGDTRSQARLLLPRYSAGSLQDSFCLAGGRSLRAVYASPTIVKTSIARADRAKVSGRIALILTATRHYAIHGIHPGTRARPRGLGQPLHAGGATWYVIRGARANGIIEVRRGTVVAVGIADTRLSATRAAAMRLLRAAAS